MIDEKRLNLFMIAVQDGCDIGGTPEELLELIRLARIGIWIEQIDSEFLLKELIRLNKEEEKK